MTFELVQTFYWLALATWFGGVLFVALAAPIVFRTIRENNPILPTVLSVNLEDEHSSLLAGSVVGNILRMLSNVSLGCAGVLLLTLIAQWLVMDRTGHNILAAALRSTLFVAAAALALYDRFAIWPKVWQYRQEYIEHADEPEVANPAKDQFDRYHRESVRLLSVMLVLLSLLVVFGSTVTPRPAWG
jgi:hypothetical protein